MSDSEFTNCIPEVKVKRKPRVKKEKKEKKETVRIKLAEEFVFEDEVERDSLREQLIAIAVNKPDILTNKFNLYSVELIEDMSINEMKARILSFKMNQGSMLDSNVVSNGLYLCNIGIGSILGITQELNESVQQDKLLLDSTKEFINLEFLHLIPHYLKIGGLYLTHVASALSKKKPQVADIPEVSEELKEKILNLREQLSQVQEDN